MKVILDTNFIIACVKNKIDFLDDFKENGYTIVLPNLVDGEVSKLQKTGIGDDKKHAKIASIILKYNDFEKVDLGKGHTDEKILDFVKSNKGYDVATIDSAFKKKLEPITKVWTILDGTTIGQG